MSPGTINICKPGNLSNDVYNQLFLVISNLHVNGKTFFFFFLYDFLTGCPDKDFQEDYTLVNAHCHS